MTFQELIYVITGEDLEILEQISKRLFSEKRMNADEMRDTAERLRLLIERARKCADFRWIKE